MPSTSDQIAANGWCGRRHSAASRRQFAAPRWPLTLHIDAAQSQLKKNDARLLQMFCATNSSTACSSSNNLTKPYARANCFTFLSSYFFAFLSLIGEVRRWGSGEESSYLENNFVESVLCRTNCNFFEWIWKINSSSYLRVSLVQYSASGSVKYRHQSTVNSAWILKVIHFCVIEIYNSTNGTEGSNIIKDTPHLVLIYWYWKPLISLIYSLYIHRKYMKIHEVFTITE